MKKVFMLFALLLTIAVSAQAPTGPSVTSLGNLLSAPTHATTDTITNATTDTMTFLAVQRLP